MEGQEAAKGRELVEATLHTESGIRTLQTDSWAWREAGGLCCDPAAPPALCSHHQRSLRGAGVIIDMKASPMQGR